MNTRPKRHEVLDALRGLCALVVVALHVCEAHRRGDLLPHAHLAVEYFFMLTGFTFVIAYDGRWVSGGLTVGRFLWRRFARLWPPVLIGSFVGLMLCFFMAGRFYGRTPPDVAGQVGRFLYSLTMLPLPCSKGMINPMQPQTWTLLYIVYANVLYALVLRHLKPSARLVALVAAAGYSVWATQTYQVLAMGWEFETPHVVVATARMCFPLFLGMLVAAGGWRLAFRGAGLVSAALLAVALLAPWAGARDVAGWYELGMVFAALPLVLLTGAGGSIPEGRFAAFCRFMGRYSFPLYATHYPFTTLLRAWIEDHPSVPASGHAACVFALLVAMAAVAWLAMLGADRLAGLLSPSATSRQGVSR